MIQQHIYQTGNLPEQYKCQVLSFMRIEWPELFAGDLRLRDWITPPDMHPVAFLLEEQGILISFLEVVWKNLHHAGVDYTAYGLTGVLTYPVFRKQGFGMRLVLAAKEYIERQGDADIVIFHSTVKGFYEQAGFERMDDLVTFTGDPQNPQRSGETGFMLFMSEKGKRGKADFAQGPLYFGDYTW